MIEKFSVRKPYTVLVAVVIVIILGVVSFTKMTADLLPNISLPYVIVMTTYIGASPETVESVVTEPVEAAMATVSNIESISSVSSENVSTVIMEFSQTADMNSVSLEIRESLDQIKSYWDESVGNPIIMKLNPDMMPVMVTAVGGEGMTYSEVSQMVESKIAPELESLEGVASVSTSGILEESVHVIIEQDKIDAINRQVFGYIEGEMADAEQELVDGRAEIADGMAELNEAQQELNDSRSEIIDGLAEVETGKTELEEGQQELDDRQESTAAELADAERQLLTAKADLEAAKTQITTQIASVKLLWDGLDKAREIANQARPQLQAGLDALKSPIVSIESIITPIREEKARVEGVQAILAATVNELAGQGIVVDITPMTIAELQGIGALLPPDVEPPGLTTLLATLNDLGLSYGSSKTLAEVVTELSDQLAPLEEQLAPLKEQESQLLDQQSIMETKLAETEAVLHAATMSLPADEFIRMMEGQLSEINGNITKVDEGLAELKKGNLTAAIEFANAQTQIDLGEMQLESAEAQLEAGEGQMETGQDQITDGLDQLNDALDQIVEGEEQLAEAREDALADADMHGVLTVDTVKALLAAQNFSMPGGYVTEEGIDYLVRVGDKPDDIEALKAMPLMNMNMDGVDVITLGDVADVFMTDNSGEIYTNVNGNNGILLTIQKQTGYSTGEVSDRLLERYDQLRQEDDKLILITFMDQGIYIDLVMNSIFNNIIFGAALAILILIIFLRDIKPTLVIAFSIPISLVTALVCMYFSGVTLNVISLSGLALGIGMLVDNSIVVIENIYRLRSEGYSMTEAAIMGTKEVAGAIAASTLTTICVFAPIVFTEGITRQLFVDMGLTIAYSLVASLVIALTVVPAMSSKMMSKAKAKQEGKLYHKLVNGYEVVLKLSLKFKPVVLILVLLLTGASAALSLSRGTAFMEDMDSTQMSVSLTFPEDTLLEQTARVTDEVVARIREIPEVTDSGANLGGGGYAMLLGGGGDAATNSTNVYVLMSEDKERTNVEIAAELKESLDDIVVRENIEMSIQTSEMDISMMGGDGVSIQIRGRELDTLQTLATDVAAIVATVEGTSEVSNGLEDATGELRVVIDRNKAIEHGLTVAQVFQQIAARLSEASSSTALQTEIRDYDVYVKNAGDLALTRETLKQLEIDVTDRDGNKEKIQLAEIALFENNLSPSAINRIEQNRYIGVTAKIAEGYNVGLVSEQVVEALADYPMPQGYELVFEGENEFINEAMEQLVLMLILALMFMFLIMVAQFQSLLSPFIIMFTIPLAFTGGFLGLYLSGSVVSIIAVIGFVMLSGVIVNNGIVMVDYVNQLRERGASKYDALIEAGRTRLRPVLMTALTTILAMSTMVVSNDMGSEMARPMAIVTIGGLIYGTLMTLIVIPCVYDIFNPERRSKDKTDRLIGKKLGKIVKNKAADNKATDNKTINNKAVNNEAIMDRTVENGEDK
ncbi:MAG: efflux RND transporter permease subunit [Lachnospiraceae bacterium]|jgi:HAE1 family hydrophobic/amphiphilic exporter-1|nr:efflux RND transporter permease subunit [Lachnospiraceae bacterium]